MCVPVYIPGPNVCQGLCVCERVYVCALIVYVCSPVWASECVLAVAGHPDNKDWTCPKESDDLNQQEVAYRGPHPFSPLTFFSPI